MPTCTRTRAADALQHSLYGVPVMVTNSLEQGTALIGDFTNSCVIYRTGGASVTIHDSAPRSDGQGGYVADYRLNQVVFRAELRAEVAVLRPLAFRQVSSTS